MMTASPAFAQATPQRSSAYFSDAQRLASVLGEAHGARFVCNGRDDQYWRRHMIDLLALEAPDSGVFRDGLVRAFNNSFSRAQARYSVCDSATIAAERDAAKEGREIADRMAAFYFPSR